MLWASNWHPLENFMGAVTNRMAHRALCELGCPTRQADFNLPSSHWPPAAGSDQALVLHVARTGPEMRSRSLAL